MIRKQSVRVDMALLRTKCDVLAHNIRCLIHAIHELDLTPVFDAIIPQRHTPAQQVLGW